MPQNPATEIPPMSADRLTSQLYHLPAIIGRLGLSVANAQRALNADYTENVKELAGIIGSLLPAANGADQAEPIKALLRQLAPSRYQFTETTLDFSADLSESLDVAGSIGLGAGFGAVVINAGVSLGFGRDYRAAARIKTILSAIPADQTLTEKLFDRAQELASSGVPLPPRTQVSAATQNNLRDILQLSGGKALPKLPAELPLSPRQQAERAAVEASQFRESAAAFAGMARQAATAAEAEAKKPEAERNVAAIVAQARAARSAASEAANAARATRIAKAETEAAAARVDAADKSDTAAAAKAVETATDALTAADASTQAAAADAAKAAKAATDAGGTV